MEITNRLLLDWMQYLENNQYAQNTIENYFTDVKLFLEFMKHKNTVSTVYVENLSLIEIENRKTTLSKTLTPKNSIYYTVRPTLSQATIQSKLTAIKSLMKYLNYYYDVGIDYRKIELKKCKSDYIECLTDEEYQTFYNYIGDFEKYKINSLRMQLLCNIAYTSGLRLSEILSLKIEDVKKSETRITGKGNKTRWVFFTGSSQSILESYLEEREKPTPRTGKTVIQSDFIFTSLNIGKYSGLPLKKNTVCERIKKYSDTLDLGKRITIHSLRHSYATKLLESGMNIREIQELLGHCDIQTTEGYCHVLKPSLKNKVMGIFS